MGDERGRGEREEGRAEEGEEGNRGEGRELVEGMEGLGEACGEELETLCETRGGRNTSGGSKTDFSTSLQTPEVGFHLPPTRTHLLLAKCFDTSLLLLNDNLVKSANKCNHLKKKNPSHVKCSFKDIFLLWH